MLFLSEAEHTPAITLRQLGGVRASYFPDCGGYLSADGGMTLGIQPSAFQQGHGIRFIQSKREPRFDSPRFHTRCGASLVCLQSLVYLTVAHLGGYKRTEVKGHVSSLSHRN